MGNLTIGQRGAVRTTAGDIVIVAADLLYEIDVAASLGAVLGRAVRERGQHVIVADPGRAGRRAFLEAFAAYVDGARFVERDVPRWTSDDAGVFGGSRAPRVGLLEWSGPGGSHDEASQMTRGV